MLPPCGWWTWPGSSRWSLGRGRRPSGAAPRSCRPEFRRKISQFGAKSYFLNNLGVYQVYSGDVSLIRDMLHSGVVNLDFFKKYIFLKKKISKIEGNLVFFVIFFYLQYEPLNVGVLPHAEAHALWKLKL